MELLTAFLAQSAEVVSDGRLYLLGGGIDAFDTDVLPTIVPPFSIVARFRFSSDECEKPHPYRLEITGPAGSQFSLAIQSTVFPTKPLYFEARGVNLFVAILINNLIFDLEGLWSFNFLANESLLGGFTVGIVMNQPAKNKD
jgi:hypothetical protein